MEGNLYKWTNLFSGWKERYFVLKGSILYYYYNKNDTPKGKIFLGLSTIIAEDDTPSFELNTGSNILFMKANSLEERNAWIMKMRVGKLEGEKQIKTGASAQNPSLLSNAIIENTIKRIMMNNQSFEDLIKKYNSNIPQEFTALLDRYKNDINDLKKTLDKNATSALSNNTGSPLKSKAPPNPEKKYSNEPSEEVTYSKGNDIFYGMSDNDYFDEDDYGSDSNTARIMKERIRNTETNEGDENQKMRLMRRVSLNGQGAGKEFFDPLYEYSRRTTLPVPKKEMKLNVWQFASSAVGKDLSRFGLPVFLNEPLSMLQKLCENFQYAYLLNNAAQEPNPFMRLAYCACFCIGGFVMNPLRTTKIFNPLLMETFEYIDNEQNFRFYSEQVSHHPAISACYAEGRGWNFYTNNNAILNFLISGKLEITNIGRCYVNFSNFNENIVFTKPLAVVRNLILGTIIIDMMGKFTVSNDQGDVCEVEMIPSTSGVQGNLKGVCKDVYGKKNLIIEGNWLDNIYVVNPETNEKKIIWKIIPSSDAKNYYFQPYSFDLNNLTEEMKSALPRTDSRFRPDQRLMEKQEIDAAADEKHRLEEKQRATRKTNKEKGIVPKPLYFDETYDDVSGELIYKYKGNYFEDRKNKNLSHFPDIF